MNNVLMLSHFKTGNHWVVFVIGNYQRLIRKEDPLNWVEALEFSKFKPGCKYLANELIYNSESVNFARIEYVYPFGHEEFINSFDKRIFLYRNPCDVMVSMFYYFHQDPKDVEEINSQETFKGYEWFEDYTTHKIDDYIASVRESLKFDHDVILYYDELWSDPSPFREVLKLFYDEIDEDIFQETLRVSSFNSIHQREVDFKKWEGVPRVKRAYHARKGAPGQYKRMMSEEMIEYINKKWNELKKEVNVK